MKTEIQAAREKIATYYKSMPRRDWLLLGLLFAICIGYSLLNKESETAGPKRTQKSFDTFIPTGHVLVPIEIANLDSLNGVFESTGKVDLYISTPASNQEGFKRKKVASGVKMLRAPLDPNQFAVLVPDAMASNLVRHEGGFTVALLNPKAVLTKNAQLRTRRLIIQEAGE